ncbi:glycosyltransferase family 2 protein [Crassaminicella thermophila]|uniref:Glycosyltransferase family 2 protein n=1 Tax=Crassaminicella thermophila TaxID=2599308 RepID=A0A5C0SEK2_CRATE|nr:glycosyltransferase family 2 protein [Crassaminicella thermophila]QEK12206.1 glycosyltransferase family 2 protein [Crassaminicella thermophila]
MSNSITVLVPAYNEADRIKDTIYAIKGSRYVDRIVVLDDGSKDDTYHVVSSTGVEAYRLNNNKGKGFALKLGIEKVLEESSIVVFLDADLGKTASEVDKLIVPIIKDEADVTIARFSAPKKKGGFGIVKNLAKHGVKFYTGCTINTSLSGQRAFKSKVLKKLGDFPSDYGVEVGMTIDIINMGFRIKEIDVNMTHRETGRDIKSFMHRGKQFYQIFLTLLQKSKGEIK